MTEWKLVEKDEDPEGPYFAYFTDSGKKEEYWWYASVKWDGCIELIHRHNDPTGDDKDQMHICDIDDMIATLQALKAEAKKVLGPRHGLYETETPK